MTAAAASLGRELDDAPLTPLHWKIWFLSAMGVFLDGYDLFIMAVALPLIARDFGPGPALLGLIGASAVVGAIAGAALSGLLADRLGRKLLYFADLLFFILFAVATALAWDIWSLLAFRFLLGFGIGADYPISASYVSESMPARVRGRLMTAGFAFQAVGSLSGAALGLLILSLYPQEHAWRFMLVSGVAPALIVLLLRTSLPESPRWYLAHGRTAEAEAVTAMICGRTPPPATLAGEVSRSAAAFETVAPSAASSTPAAARQQPFQALFSARYRRRTVLAVVPWFLMDIALYGVGFFTPVILAALEPADRANSFNFIRTDIIATEGDVFLDLFLVAGFALAILTVERWGRIRLQTLGFAGMAAGLTVLALAATLPDGATGRMALIFAGFVLFNLMVNWGPNPTTFLLPAELFPDDLRASGHGLAAAAGKTGAAVGIFLLPVLKDAIGLTPTLLIVAATTTAGLLITLAFRVETAGRSLDAIDASATA